MKGGGGGTLGHRKGGRYSGTYEGGAPIHSNRKLTAKSRHYRTSAQSSSLRGTQYCARHWWPQPLYSYREVDYKLKYRACSMSCSHIQVVGKVPLTQLAPHSHSLLSG